MFGLSLGNFFLFIRCKKNLCLNQICSPFYRFNVFPVGGRSTVIKLSNGDLWVAASTPLDTDTKSKLEDLGGKVKYIIGLDAVHNLYLRNDCPPS